MSELIEFMKKEKPRRKSKLADFNQEIAALKKGGYTIKQIHSFLTSVKKVEVNAEYLARHIRNLDLNKNNSIEDSAASVGIKKEESTETVVKEKEGNQSIVELLKNTTTIPELNKINTDNLSEEDKKLVNEKRMSILKTNLDKNKGTGNVAKVWEPSKKPWRT